MTTLQDVVTSALIHSLWQDTAIALLVGCVLAPLRHRSANLRYVVACGALAAMFILPIATVSLTTRAATLTQTAGMQPNTRPAAPAAGTSQPLAPPSRAASSSSEQAGPLAGLFSLWAFPLWCAGVVCFSVRLLAATVHTRTLLRQTTPAESHLVATVARLAKRVGIADRVRVLTSTIVDAPATLGWLRPVILVPPATAMGLTPLQLEALLAHELAHIRRHDFIVNALQMVVETLYFHHPAVWWVSSRIRIEREHCCDDAAVATCGDAFQYAQALARVAHRTTIAPQLALGAGSGPLLRRIQRLLGVPSQGATSAMRGVAPLVVTGLLLVVAGIGVAATAQQPSTTSAPETLREGGGISGRVVDAQTRLPLDGATVEIRARINAGVSEQSNYRQRTRADGRYNLRGIQPGEYLVSVSAAAYGRTYLGQTANDNVQSGGADGTIVQVPVRVVGGQTTADVDLMVTRRSSLSGRILGATGSPVNGIEVELLRRTYQAGGSAPTVVAFRQTEGLSMFRMTVPPGDYYIRAYPGEGVRPGRGASSIAFAPTFYPGVSTLAEAETINLAPGQELSELNFIIATIETTRVSGRLIDPGGASLTRAMVELTPQGPGSEGELLYSPVDVAGRFAINRVIPGEYMLTVQDMANPTRWMGVRERLTVTGALSDLEIAASYGAHIEGRIVADDRSAIRYGGAGMELAFRYVDTSGRVDDTGWTHTEVGGTFALDATPGEAVLDVTRLAPGWIVQSASLDGIDITDLPVSLRPSQRSRLDIVITQRAAAVRGKVTTEDDGVHRHAPVIIFPADPSRWNVPRLIYAGFSQPDGTFAVDDVAPGDYRAVAVTSLPPNAWKDPRVIERLWPYSVSLALREGVAKAVTLKATEPPTYLFQ